MSYASTFDVQVELGRPASSTAEASQWQAWLARVERSIERGFRRAGLVLADQVALNEPTKQDVIDVEVAVTIRKIQLPSDGRTSTTRAVDDASITERWESDTYGGLDLTDDDWNSLLPGSDSQAFSTRPGFTADIPVGPSPWDYVTP